MFFFILMACTITIHAKKFPVRYTMTISPTCQASFDGWVDVDANPFSSTFGNVTSYGGTVTITGSGCNPGSYPVSGIISGNIPSTGFDGDELNSSGIKAVITILQNDEGLNEAISKITS